MDAVLDKKGEAADEKAAKPVCAFLGCALSLTTAVVSAAFGGVESSWGSGVLGLLIWITKGDESGISE